MSDQGPTGPAGPGWREETALFKGAGRRLVGVLSLPESKDAPRAAAVVLHGWGSYRSGPHRMLVELCRRLAAEGLAALRFDLSGRGDSGGDYWETDLDRMVADAGAAANFLLKRTGARRLVACGLCSGANVALGAASADERFKAVAALSTLPFQKQRRRGQSVRRRRSTLRELFLKALRWDTYRRLLRGEVSVGRILRRLMRGEGGLSARVENASDRTRPRNLKASRRDIQKDLAAFRGRLFFVYGAADAEGVSGWEEVLRPSLVESGVEHLQVEVAGADHDYHGWGARRQAIDATVRFLSA